MDGPSYPSLKTEFQHIGPHVGAQKEPYGTSRTKGPVGRALGGVASREAARAGPRVVGPGSASTHGELRCRGRRETQGPPPQGAASRKARLHPQRSPHDESRKFAQVFERAVVSASTWER